MRTFFLKSVLATGLGIFAATANAQDTTDDWSGQATLYGWMPSIQGAQKRQDGTPVVDIKGTTLLEALQGFFFATAEARKGKTGVFVDLAYANLGMDGSASGSIIPGANPAKAALDTKFLMSTAAVSYRFHDDGERWIDAYGGLRYFDVETDFALKVPGLGFSTTRSANASWVDGIIGLRGHAPIGGRFAVTGLADVGGFGIGASSNLSWQIIGTLDYSFSDQLVGRLGYRYLSIDKTSSSLSMDVDMFGPMIGLTWTF